MGPHDVGFPADREVRKRTWVRDSKWPVGLRMWPRERPVELAPPAAVCTGLNSLSPSLLFCTVKSNDGTSWGYHGVRRSAHCLAQRCRRISCSYKQDDVIPPAEEGRVETGKARFSEPRACLPGWLFPIVPARSHPARAPTLLRLSKGSPPFPTGYVHTQTPLTWRQGASEVGSTPVVS